MSELLQFIRVFSSGQSHIGMQILMWLSDIRKEIRRSIKKIEKNVTCISKKKEDNVRNHKHAGKKKINE